MAGPNERKAILLLALTSTALLLAGRLLAGPIGMYLMLPFALAVAVAACWFPERLVLWMADAGEAPEAAQPELHRLVEQVAARAGLPKPRVWLIDDPAPNAFAVGRDPRHAAICLTSGLLDLLDDVEGAAVVAHELAHVARRDALLGGVLATVVFAVTLPLQAVLWSVQALVDLGRGYAAGREWEDPGFARRRLMLYLAPLVAPALRLAAPRRREHLADGRAVELAAGPLPLAGALRKMAEAVALGPPLEADPAMHHLFIVNPAPDERIDWLLSTRPPLDERLDRLRQLAGAPG